ncbi:MULTISPECIES: YceD family protein [unclassified Maridesulfovibrio]|uniref:YceD family protein n=1 Tax=unclassified Maridesulfovibrio TaxID=2794999 RepID=UPI003B3CCC1C
MSELWITLNDIPEEGQNFVFEDQNFWSAAWKQYKVDVRPGDALVSEVYVLPQDKGCLVRGGTEGSVTIACDRCTADYKHNISTEFEEYEQVAEDGDDEPSPVVKTKEGLKIDIGALLWEHFVMALPIKPLCKEECKGLCGKCGADLNEGGCECEQEEGDPRLAVFRNLKIKN